MKRSLVPFLTLVERESYRIFRLFKQTVVPPVITTVLFILIFGFSLGSRIHEIDGFSYILYILPGLAGMGVLTNAFSNTTTSIFLAKLDKSIQGILTAPLSYVEIVLAFVLGGVVRGVVVGCITLLVAYGITDLAIASPFLTLLIFILSSFCFSAFGVSAALWAEEWDQMATLMNFVLTPLTYLGGVFYSVQMLPPVWKYISLCNPLFYMIDATRYAVLGTADQPIVVSLSVLLGFSVFAFALALVLFKRGYKIVV